MFVPGNRDKLLKESENISVDALIFDLEDAVPHEDKESARLKIKKTMKRIGRKNNYVRVNSISTHYFLDDINALINEDITGIMLPMTNSSEDIIILDYILEQMERKSGLPRYSVAILPIIETASGLYCAYEIAKASKRINQLAFGAEDFMLDLKIKPDEQQAQLLYARSKLVNTSRAAGIEAPIDSVFKDIRDLKGLEIESQKAKGLGFQGKLIIHPEQIEPVNKAFHPTKEEIIKAKIIVEKYESAAEIGIGAIQVDGKMVDFPVAQQAKQILYNAGIKL